MSSNDDRDPFPGVRVPRAPAELRQRALQAATSAMRVDPQETFWDRIWESRLLARSWATVTLGLLVAHAVLSLVSGSPGRTTELRTAERRQASELRKLIDLPDVEISPRAAAIALGGKPRPKKSTRPDETTPSSRS